LATPSRPVGTWLAFDFGEKRIGVAIGNTVTGGARPLCVIPASPVTDRFSRIEALIREWEPAACLVGLPVDPDGEDHPFAARCRRFANQLHGRFGLPVILEDERYTSALAPGDDAVDAEAAAILLQGLLDAKVDSA
jgi:putative Holliday junction resolvase